MTLWVGATSPLEEPRGPSMASRALLPVCSISLSNCPAARRWRPGRGRQHRTVAPCTDPKLHLKTPFQHLTFFNRRAMALPAFIF